jgi:hypothetical protein
MKMGNTRSPFPYDATARHALQSASLRRPAILRYAPRGGLRSRSALRRFRSGGRAADRGDATGKQPVLFYVSFDRVFHVVVIAQPIAFDQMQSLVYGVPNRSIIAYGRSVLMPMVSITSISPCFFRCEINVLAAPRFDWQ